MKAGYRRSGRIVDYNLKSELEHGIYVSRLARELASELGCTDEEQYLFAQAGLVHDIGKLRLTGNDEEEVLLIDEIQYVRSHSRLSYEILKEEGYGEELLDIIYHHHENYDGTGYPDRLQGDEIPLGSRIIRVCDVFAALTTDRPYRKRFRDEEAMNMMIEEISHFDMKIFLCFQRIAHRGTGAYHFYFEEELNDVFDEEAGERNEGHPAGRNGDPGVRPVPDPEYIS